MILENFLQRFLKSKGLFIGFALISGFLIILCVLCIVGLKVRKEKREKRQAEILVSF